MIVHTMEYNEIKRKRIDCYYECDYIDIAYYAGLAFISESGSAVTTIALCNIIEIYNNDCSL